MCQAIAFVFLYPFPFCIMEVQPGSRTCVFDRNAVVKMFFHFPHVFPCFIQLSSLLKKGRIFHFPDSARLKNKMFVLGAGFWALGSLGASLLNILDKRQSPRGCSRGGGPCVWYCVSLVVAPGKMQVSVVSFPCLVSRWVKFPSSRFFEIEERYECSWYWFLSIGITGGQPLEYSRQKDKAPVVVLEGGWGSNPRYSGGP